MEALRPQFDEVRGLLEGAETIIVTGHESADGDAVGAVAALRRHLELEGKSVHAILADPLNPRYGFMEFSRRYSVYDPAVDDERISAADVVMMCDLSMMARLGPMQAVVEANQGTLVCFDHHPCEGEGPGDINVMDVRATATGTLVYDYIRHVGGDIDREIAESVFVSLSTDTGWFRYPNTDARALELAGELAAYRLDLPGMYQAIYRSNPSPMLRLLGHVARTMTEEADGALVWSYIRRSLMDDLGVGRYDADPILDVLRSREMVRLVALFTEKADGACSVSLRSSGDPDVNLVARRFGGGGHSYSAGTVFPAGEAERMRREMLAQLRQLAKEADG